ncbi:MAG TPA: SRPBCC domain-containing protein [Bacteroidia bacterium]|jgi:uncharacterized protein YndB with AHSA1/START domain|nr:SRPBCC domain-containing protein [Bacteroidia bacterium]HQF27561.1 SRPBCC domain-containing protein [Bacteroidia bacterium]HQK97638.1 SRPBCC domain-containing protein [Bacteroidia bacterium]
MAVSYSFKTTYIVYATPEQVFEALTDSGIIAAWGGGLAVVENKIDGHFELFDGWVKGKVTEYKPGQELGYTWKPEEWDKRTKPSVVSMKFKSHAAGTDVVLIHSDFPSQEEADKHGNGWIDYVLDPINDYFVMLKDAPKEESK